MKRHDVSNSGPGTRYPNHGHPVILWFKDGGWNEGWFEDENGEWCDAHSYSAQEGVIAWSDPTEPESAEPFAWALTSNLFGGPRPLTAYNNRQLAEDVAAAIDPSLQVVPLYATPPDSLSEISKAIHYPECWDVAAYPTVREALIEMYAYFKCVECQRKPDESAPTVDHTAVMRQAEEAIVGMLQYTADLNPNQGGDDDPDAVKNASAALAALRGAIGGV